MKTISKKLFSLLLVVIMIASVIPFQAFAATVNCPNGHPMQLITDNSDPNNCKYYYCETCHNNSEPIENYVFVDAENHGDPIPAGSNAPHVEGTEVPTTATCTAAGQKAYIPCTLCDAKKVDGVWTKDAADLVAPATGHDFSTATIEGGNENTCYRIQCAKCNAYFACTSATDKTLLSTTPLDAAKSYAAEHDFVDGKCSRCEVQKPSDAPELTEKHVDITVKFYTEADEANSKPAQYLTGEDKTISVTVKVNKDGKIDSIVDTDKPYITIPDAPYDTSLNFNTVTYLGAGIKDSKNVTFKFAAEKNAVKGNLTYDHTAAENVVACYVKPNPEVVATKLIYHTGTHATLRSTKATGTFETTVSYTGLLPDVQMKPNDGYTFKYSAENPLYWWVDANNNGVQDAGEEEVVLYPGTSFSTTTIATGGTVHLYPVVSVTSGSLLLKFYDVNTKKYVLTDEVPVENTSVTIGTVLDSKNWTTYFAAKGAALELSSGKTAYKTLDTTWASGTTVGDVNASRSSGYGAVIIKVKSQAVRATYLSCTNGVNALVKGAASYTEEYTYGKTYTMPIPTVQDGLHKFVGWQLRGTSKVYNYVVGQKLEITVEDAGPLFFDAIYDNSAGVYVYVYFNDINERQMFIAQIYDVKNGDTLKKSTVMQLLGQYITYSSSKSTGLYNAKEWNEAVTSKFNTSAGHESVTVNVDDNGRAAYYILLRDAKFNGKTITDSNWSVDKIGVNKNGAYAPVDPSNPKTGNEAQMLGVAVATMVMAVITLGGVTYYTRKKEEMI